MDYFLKSPIGSLVRALTIFKSSFKYFNLIVISSPCKKFASVDELLLLSVAFELFDVDCPTSSGLALEMLVDELPPPPPPLLLIMLLLLVVVVVVVVAVVVVVLLLPLLVLLDTGFASRFDGKLFCSALLLLLILLLILVLPLLVSHMKKKKRNKIKLNFQKFIENIFTRHLSVDYAIRSNWCRTMRLVRDPFHG